MEKSAKIADGFDPWSNRPIAIWGSPQRRGEPLAKPPGECLNELLPLRIPGLSEHVFWDFGIFLFQSAERPGKKGKKIFVLFDEKNGDERLFLFLRHRLLDHLQCLNFVLHVADLELFMHDLLIELAKNNLLFCLVVE